MTRREIFELARDVVSSQRKAFGLTGGDSVVVGLMRVLLRDIRDNDGIDLDKEVSETFPIYDSEGAFKEMVPLSVIVRDAQIEVEKNQLMARIRALIDERGALYAPYKEETK